jgi:hypothetical protein
MNTTINNLLSKMNEELQQAALSAEDHLKRAERSYYIVHSKVDELKGYILNYSFKDTKEEIQFFKEIKPKFLKELVYYSELYYIESNKPVDSLDSQRSYYLQEMKRVRLFFERNQFLHVYYRTGKSMYDDLFFLRDTKHELILPHSLPEIDYRFSTVQSYKLSKIFAFESLREYLQQTVNHLEHVTIEPVRMTDNLKPQLTWTDSKVHLIEWGYAIFSKGAVNNGNADIKVIMSAFEYLFNVDLGNYYAVFNQNIRLRKKNRTVYHDQSKDSLVKYMDDLDDNLR